MSLFTFNDVKITEKQSKDNYQILLHLSVYAIKNNKKIFIGDENFFKNL